MSSSNATLQVRRRATATKNFILKMTHDRLCRELLCIYFVQIYDHEETGAFSKFQHTFATKVTLENPANGKIGIWRNS